MRHDQLVPSFSVGGVLGAQTVADGIETRRGHSRHALRHAGQSRQRERYGRAHKVHVADVGVQLVVVERELGEPPVRVDVGVRRVRDRRFHQRRARVEEERERRVDREPDPSAGDVRDRHRHRVARGSERDCTIVRNGRPDRIGGRRVERCLPVRRKEE